MSDASSTISLSLEEGEINIEETSRNHLISKPAMVSTPYL